MERGGWKSWTELLSFCWFAHWGTHPEHLNRASYDTQVALVHHAPISQLTLSLFAALCALSSSLSFSVCMYSYALIPHPLCCPWPRMLTDADWGCRAQLGPIEAVYLIKTCEDPTGASAREDTASIYRSEHRRAHTPPYPGRARKTRNQVPLFDTGDPVYPSINMEKCRRNSLCNDISILPCTWFKSRCALMIVHTLTVCVIYVFFIM